MGKNIGEDRLDAFFNLLTEDLDRFDSAGPCQAALRLRERAKKRALYDRPELRPSAEAAFLATNADVGNFSVDLADPRIPLARAFILHVLEGYVKSVCPESLQECFSWTLVTQHWAFGPGASHGVRGQGTVEKIDQAMTCTESAEPYVQALLRRHDPYFQCYDALHGSDGVRVEGSRLDFVAKNETTLRTIAIEPSGNMAFQLAGGRVIQAAMSRIGLDITTQEAKNKALARRGSLTGALATIDLKSASDRIHPDLVRAIWPEEWVKFFSRFRCNRIQVSDGSYVGLNMVSTMGNGFTFPMMTLTFLSLVVANRLHMFGGNPRYVDWTRTAVYGDDIIVPTAEAPALCQLLHSVGFLVNLEKSYLEGPFRESCGGDYWEGVDITPFYVESLRYPAEIYVAFNKVLDWACRHGQVPFRALKYLRELLSKVYLVPEWCNPDSGIRTAQCDRRYKMLQPKVVLHEYRGTSAGRLVSGGFLVEGYASLDGEISSFRSKRFSNTVLAYTPRQRSVHYRTLEARLPSGYLDGWDPLARSRGESNLAALIVSLVL